MWNGSSVGWQEMWCVILQCVFVSLPWLVGFCFHHSLIRESTMPVICIHTCRLNVPSTWPQREWVLAWILPVPSVVAEATGRGMSWKSYSENRMTCMEKGQLLLGALCNSLSSEPWESKHNDSPNVHPTHLKTVTVSPDPRNRHFSIGHTVLPNVLFYLTHASQHSDPWKIFWWLQEFLGPATRVQNSFPCFQSTMFWVVYLEPNKISSSCTKN